MKKYLQNLHTHTTYCDGIDSPEQMILAAIDQGFDSVGFSMHSFMRGCTVSEKIIEQYKWEISALKELYADKIEVYLGLECEMYGKTNLTGFDYLIGALHYLCIDGEYYSIDRSLEDTKRIIEKHFEGDGMLYARAYYDALAELPKHGAFDIIAHFDLITKYNEKEQLFDVSSKEYQKMAIEAAEKLAGKIPCFEVNTGAMARGYRTSPYPDLFLLKELKRLGFGAIISSDCHDSRQLECGYQKAAELLREAGFKEKFILTKEGLVSTQL